jgi:hypothetical protein
LAGPNRDRNATLNKAQSHFLQHEQRTELVKREVEKEREMLAARTAKLKLLRLAKEADDKIVAEKLAAEALAEKRAKAASRAKKAKVAPESNQT